jgi:hypothetical protein
VRASVLSYEAWRAQQAGDPEASRQAAEEALSVAGEFPFWAAFAGAFSSWAVTRETGAPEGLAALAASIAGLRAAGVRTMVTSLHTLQVDLLLRLGRRCDRPAGERTWDAELHRLAGELHLVGESPDPVAARASLERALDIARHQGAGRFESQATAVLQRLPPRGEPALSPGAG